jgi:lipoate-protein ligase A
VEGGKLVKVLLSTKDGKIEKVKITGDFFMHPETFIEDLENALHGRPIDEKDLAAFIRYLFEKEKVVLLGASPEDLARCIVKAAETNG